MSKEKARQAGRGTEVQAGQTVPSSTSHLHLALDLEVEAFIPLWVWAVGDGPSPQPLMRGGGQPEAHIAVCLAHCPVKTRVGGKGEVPTPVQRGESGESEGTSGKSLQEQEGLASASGHLLTHECASPEMFVLEPREAHGLQARGFTWGPRAY